MPVSKVVRHSLQAGAVCAAALLYGGCGGGSQPHRPTTPARLQIVAPAPNQTSPGTVHLELNLIGGQVVQPNKGPLRPTEGHIHVSLDGQLVSMTYGTTQDLPDVPPGPHSIQADFVATDHQPFANRVVASVLFTVAP